MDDRNQSEEPQPPAVTRRRFVLGATGAGIAGVAGLATAGAIAGATESPGSPIGPAKKVPVGDWAAFTDPKTHQPSIVIQLHRGKFVVYDAICPHEGCTVGYVPAEKIILCPWHGSEFNPSNGDVVHGPAPRGLRTLGITLGANGEFYVKR